MKVSSFVVFEGSRKAGAGESAVGFDGDAVFGSRLLYPWFGGSFCTRGPLRRLGFSISAIAVSKRFGCQLCILAMTEKR